MKDIKLMNIAEFRQQGFLQEANRLFFHPHGLALAVAVEADGTERLHGIWDYREDPEGIVFGDGPNAEKADRVAMERARHTAARTAVMGNDVQAPGQVWKPKEGMAT